MRDMPVEQTNSRQSGAKARGSRQAKTEEALDHVTSHLSIHRSSSSHMNLLRDSSNSGTWSMDTLHF